MTVKRIKLSDRIRQAIETCGKTRYQVSRDKSVDTATLWRFMGDKGGLSIPVLDILGEYLGLELQKVHKPRVKEGR